MPTRLEMLDRIGTLEPEVRRGELLLLMDFYQAGSLGELSDAQVYEYMKLKEAKPMIEIIDNDELRSPVWNDDKLEIIFTFRNGSTQIVSIPTATMSQAEIDAYRNQLLRTQKLVQNIFEHEPHGQITVQGLTVRADDLISMRIR